MKRLSYLLSILCALASFASFGQDTSHKALFKQVNKLFDEGKRQEGKALFVKAAEQRNVADVDEGEPNGHGSRQTKSSKVILHIINLVSPSSY